MKTVTLTHKHIDVKPVTMLVETFREMNHDEVDLYNVSFDSAIKEALEECGEQKTATGICFALGFSGSNSYVYKSIDSLVDAGEIKSSKGFLDSIYWI
ncbi:hypothetical protein VP137E351_P0029 [Vibrio phage 137E35-1]|nr:hypothetical protein VP137E351_P0029 [Vibrio phage 137E35-1]CAH9015980.1 hypothetical protein VP230E391_P0029 [Vibrio phage 230E39-1]